MSESTPQPPVFHVLVSEDFFQERVVETLIALGRTPFVPDWDADVMTQVRQEPCDGIVLDLEDNRFDSLKVLAAIQRNSRLDALPQLVFCSLDNMDLLRGIEELGVQIVARSTFAGNIVAMIKSLGESDAAA